MKKTYPIEVDCANCAAKMEAAVQKLPGVAAATVNYMTQKMVVDYADDADIAATLSAIAKACRKIDPDFSIEQ